MANLNNSGASGDKKSSTSGDNLFRDSPFGPLSEVLSDKDLSNIFSGVGSGKGSSSPFGGGSSSKTDLAYGGNPFAGDNFWNIFAGGKNPSAGGSNQGSTHQGSTHDPLTGIGSQGTSISKTEVPDGLGLRSTIDNLVNSKLKEEKGSSSMQSFGGSGSGMPSFGASGSGMPSLGASGSGMPSLGGSGNGMPSLGGSGNGISPFGGSGNGISPFGGSGSH